MHDTLNLLFEMLQLIVILLHVCISSLISERCLLKRNCTNRHIIEFYSVNFKILCFHFDRLLVQIEIMSMTGQKDSYEKKKKRGGGTLTDYE